MSIDTDPVPPVPQHTPPIDKRAAAAERFENNWMQWFIALRNKINVINSLIVALSKLTGNGFIVIASSVNVFARTLIAGSGITITNPAGTAGDPTISHADTSSVSNLSSNNSNGVVIQDFDITFDTFGHVQTVTVGTIDLDARYGADLATGSDTTKFWRGDKSWSNALTGDFTVDTSTLKVDSTNDRVGIGTASPQRKFHTVGPQGTVSSFPSGIGANVPMVLENNGNSSIALVPSTTGQSGIAVYKDGSASVNGFFRYDVGTSTWLLDVEAVTKWAVTANGFQYHSSTTSFGGGVGVIGITNATTTPTSNPSGGGILYSDAGAGKWRGSSGTTTTFGPAHPHCPICSADFVHEWENFEKGYGYLAVCINCLVRGLNSHTRERGGWSGY